MRTDLGPEKLNEYRRLPWVHERVKQPFSPTPWKLELGIHPNEVTNFYTFYEQAKGIETWFRFFPLIPPQNEHIPL